MFNLNDPVDLLYLVAVLGLVVAVGSFPAWLVARLTIGLWAIWQEREATSRTHRANATMAEASAERAHLDNLLVHPNLDGMLPIARAAVLASTGEILELMAAYQDRMRAPANVPHSLTYAPHTRDAPRAEAPQLTGPAASVVVEPTDLWALWVAGKLPEDGFLLGHDLSTGAPVTAGWKQLYSALVGGVAGSGKSTLIRSVLVQSALQGAKFVVVDPHYHAGEESLGASLMPMRSLMPFGVAGSEKEIVDALRFVQSVAQRRKDGDPDREALILVVDESTALFQRSNVAGVLAEVLGFLSQETRKMAVFALVIGHQFKDTVMPSEVRNSFASFFACRGRRDDHRAMTGNTEFARQADNLKTGEAVWLDTDGAIHRLAIPNCTERHVTLVAKQVEGVYRVDDATASPTATVEPRLLQQGADHDAERSTDGSTERSIDLHLSLDSARVQRVRQAIKGGMSKTEILKDVWGIDMSKGGAKVTAASREYDEVVRSLVA